MLADFKELKLELEKKLKTCSNVFIVGHQGPDFDSFGAAIGLCAIARHFYKKSYIIIDDEQAKIEPGVKKIIDAEEDRYRFITRQEFLELVDDKSLLIVVDTNKKDMISVGENLDKVEDVFVIDHHNENDKSIKTPYKFIDILTSSTCEMIFKLISAYKTKIKESEANYILAGISLDTKRFKKNTTSRTHDIAKKLIERGASIDYVNNLFLEEFESYCKISDLIINGTAIKKISESLLTPIQISFTLNRNAPKTVYLKEDLAKAADKMLKFNGIDASFAMGYLDDGTVHISARSNRRVNVGAIMSELSGGGNVQNAGSRVVADDIFEVERQVMEKITTGISDDEKVVDEPKLLKLKQVKLKTPKN